jgi:hypothetical protein
MNTKTASFTKEYISQKKPAKYTYARKNCDHLARIIDDNNQVIDFFFNFDYGQKKNYALNYVLPSEISELIVGLTKEVNAKFLMCFELQTGKCLEINYQTGKIMNFVLSPEDN